MRKKRSLSLKCVFQCGVDFTGADRDAHLIQKNWCCGKRCLFVCIWDICDRKKERHVTGEEITTGLWLDGTRSTLLIVYSGLVRVLLWRVLIGWSENITRWANQKKDRGGCGENRGRGERDGVSGQVPETTSENTTTQLHCYTQQQVTPTGNLS